jgi:RimJ/RimL family protein N-acetyltransferase
MKRARIIRISRFVVLYPEDLDFSVSASNPHYKRLLIPASEMRQYQPQLQDQLTESFLERAEQRGDYCYAIFDQADLVSFGWYATATAHLFDRCLTFNPNFVYMYHGYTRPDYRGERLHALGLAEAMMAFQVQEKRAIVSTINITNYPVRKSIERLGFRYSGYIMQFGPSCLGLIYVTPKAQTHGVRLGL